MSAPNRCVRHVKTKKIYWSLVPVAATTTLNTGTTSPLPGFLLPTLIFARENSASFWGYSYLSQIAEFLLWSEPWDHPLWCLSLLRVLSLDLSSSACHRQLRRLVSKGMWLVYHAIINHPAVWGSGAWLSQMSRGQIQYLPVSSCQIFPLWNAWNYKYMRRLT